MNNLEKAINHTFNQTFLVFVTLSCVSASFIITGMIIENNIVEYFGLFVIFGNLISIKYVSDYFISKSYNNLSSKETES